MIEILLGSLLAVWGFTEAVETRTVPEGSLNVSHGLTVAGPIRESVVVEPLSQLKYRNVVRQAYDYSCGSAALTTVLDYYLGLNLDERQVMEGLLHFGEAEKIAERRGFSLLDMKRFTAALGYQSGGFRAEFKDLESLEHPGIVPIEYAGFKHFVVLREIRDGRVYVADPALGSISFTQARFEEVWDQNVVFIVYPGERPPVNALALSEQDLRLVDDRTTSLLAFREFPMLAKFTENQATQMGSAGQLLETQYIRRK
ncbi:MAG TPA: C39 family peptidase [Pseudomonas sp.]|jgi:predicted double-glycine peptidase|nr:C39 family peptidase [Pseudomonas sp.]